MVRAARAAQAAGLATLSVSLREVRWVPRGGHLGFPARLDIGESGRFGIHNQVVAWLLRHGQRASILGHGEGSCA